MKVALYKRKLPFKKPAGTSRGKLLHKEMYYGIFTKKNRSVLVEFPLFRGLSYDDVPDWEKEWLKIKYIKSFYELKDFLETLEEYPSIRFGIEQVLFRLTNLETPFEGKIPINGLVWMNEVGVMLQEASEKIKSGFPCLKFKIGAIDWEEEIKMLKSIREEFPNIEIRLDANGAFGPSDCMDKLHELSKFEPHSIEQPLAINQWEAFSKIIEKSPIPIALDEELIPIREKSKMRDCLECLHPHYLIFKPGLLGGFDVCNDWMQLADKMDIGYWFTSSLESNVGLEYLYHRIGAMKLRNIQGLGTGSLFVENAPSKLEVKSGYLFLNKASVTDVEKIEWIKSTCEQC